MPLVQADLVRTVARATRLRNSEARVVVLKVLKELTRALGAGERVEIRGLGSLSAPVVSGRKGRDLQRGVLLALPPRRRVTFRPGRGLRPHVSHTLHYFGRLADRELLPELQDEYAEIAQVSGWTHERVDLTFPGESGGPGPTLRGIRLNIAPHSSQVQFTFDQEGYLAHLYYEAAETAGSPLRSGKPAPARGVRTPVEPKVLHHLHTHTVLREGHPETHRTLVRLLDYLLKRYVPNLEVIDNTGYWTTRDEQALGGRPLQLTRT
jgi:nucleoid DNA-binding protein